MDEMKIKILDTIEEMELKQESSAYFELVCTSIYGELTQETEQQLTSILAELKDMGLISINGDRIGVVRK